MLESTCNFIKRIKLSGAREESEKIKGMEEMEETELEEEEDGIEEGGGKEERKKCWHYNQHI